VQDDDKQTEIESLLAGEEEELSNLIELHYSDKPREQQEYFRTPDITQEGRHLTFSHPSSLYGSDDEEFDDIFRDMDGQILSSTLDPEFEDAMDTSGS